MQRGNMTSKDSSKHTIAVSASLAEAMRSLDTDQRLTGQAVDSAGNALGVIRASDIRAALFTGIHRETPIEEYIDQGATVVPETPADRAVLVIGGAGYLGSVLSHILIDQGYSVRVFDRLSFGNESLSDLEDNPRFECVQGDVRDITALTEALKGIDSVVLLAALVGERACDRDPQETVAVNYTATIAAAAACKYHQINRFVYASTDSAYGIKEGIMDEEQSLSPVSLYGRLKVQVEQELLAMEDDNFAPTILRMATLYGLSPRMRFDLILNILAKQSVMTGKITIYGGKQWRPLAHVADAAEAYKLALAAPLEKVKGEVFNVGSNEQNYQIYQLGDLVAEALPDVEVLTTDVAPDLRDYHVSFDKITETLGYKVRYTPADALQEIREAIISGAIADPDDRRYVNA